MEVKPDILSRASALESQFVSWRRDFHMHPELGFQEYRTAGRVAEILEQLGCRVKTGVGRTGVVADLGEGSPIFAIRADMDALPIQEANDVSYASQNPGVMHACGHDAHTAIALGAAALLAQQALPGTVRFLFQPAEEVADDEGISGAPRMISAGAMDAVAAIVALHVDAGAPVGTISVDAGASSAGVDTFYATIIGKGGHGAYPHKVVDPIYLAGHAILALHGIVSRRLHPTDLAVVSIGSIHGGQADNVIPETVEMTGTIRYMAPEVQQKIHAEIERALKVTRGWGGDYQLKIEIGYPPMFNHPLVVDLVTRATADLIGADNIRPPRRDMGAEDFGFFSKLAPGAMFRLGARIEGDERKHHHPRFDIAESCLSLGAALLAETALRYLRSGIEPQAQAEPPA